MREYEPTTEDMREHYTDLVEQAGGDGWWAGRRWDHWLEDTYDEPKKLLDAALARIGGLEDRLYDLEQDIDDLERENERLVYELADAKTS